MKTYLILLLTLFSNVSAAADYASRKDFLLAAIKEAHSTLQAANASLNLIQKKTPPLIEIFLKLDWALKSVGTKIYYENITYPKEGTTNEAKVCKRANAYVSSESDQIHLCSSFFKKLEINRLDRAVNTLVHEAFHALKGFNWRDESAAQKTELMASILAGKYPEILYDISENAYKESVSHFRFLLFDNFRHFLGETPLSELPKNTQIKISSDTLTALNANKNEPIIFEKKYPQNQVESKCILAKPENEKSEIDSENSIFSLEEILPGHKFQIVSFILTGRLEETDYASSITLLDQNASSLLRLTNGAQKLNLLCKNKGLPLFTRDIEFFTDDKIKFLPTNK